MSTTTCYVQNINCSQPSFNFFRNNNWSERVVDFPFIPKLVLFLLRSLQATLISFVFQDSSTVDDQILHLWTVWCFPMGGKTINQVSIIGCFRSNYWKMIQSTYFIPSARFRKYYCRWNGRWHTSYYRYTVVIKHDRVIKYLSTIIYGNKSWNAIKVL